VIRYLLFITVYHHLFVLWLVVAYSGLSRHALLSTTTSVHTRILAEDIVSNQDWCRYLLKYPDEAVTFYNASHPVVRRFVPTLYEINVEPPQ
jgi:hypothetical protein